MPSETELAWTAGMMDADGCISMSHGGGKWRHPYVVVDNTDMAIIKELQRLHGGGIVVKKIRNPNARQAWSWRLYGGIKIREFLARIHPYMHSEAKSERARMLIEEYPVLTPRNGYYTPSMKNAKVEFEQRFMSIGSAHGSRRWRELNGRT